MIHAGTLEITPEILSLIAQIDEFKGAWRALGTLAPERLTSLRKVATIESVGSSTRIEGSQLSDSEVGNCWQLEAAFFATRDEQEVAGYAETIALVFESWQEIPLTENLVRQLHRDLLRYSDSDCPIAAGTKRFPTTWLRLMNADSKSASSLPPPLRLTRRA